MEDRRQSREHGMHLLVHGGEITANVAKGSRSRGTAKGARDLLLHFGKASVTLSLVVGKGNGEIVEQSQHLLGTREQRIEQILGWALPGLAFPFAGAGCRRRPGSRIAERQNLEIARNPVVTLDGGNRRQVEFTPVVAGLMQIEQEVMPLLGPVLLWLPGDSQTITQQMRLTDAVRTVVPIVAGKAVMHPTAHEGGPDADLVHGLLPSRGMPGQMRQPARTVDMQPMQDAIDANAGLITMLQATGGDQLTNALDHWSQALGGQFTPRQQAGFRDLTAADGREGFTGARRRQQLSLMRIDGPGLQVGTILHRRVDLNGKTAPIGTLARGTGQALHLMLVDQQADFWYIEYLPTFNYLADDLAQVLPTLLAALGAVSDHLIGLLCHLQGLTSMPLLSSWVLVAGRTRTAWQMPQSIRGGGVTAAAAVFAQALFQFLDARLCPRQLLFQGQQLGHQGFEQSIFFSQRGQFFFLRHERTLLAFLAFGKSLGDLSSYKSLH